MLCRRTRFLAILEDGEFVFSGGIREPSPRKCRRAAERRQRTQCGRTKGWLDVERRSRALNGPEIQVCPIHHRDERRVRARQFNRLPAAYLEWSLRRALVRSRLADETLAEAPQTRAPVARAEPPPRGNREEGPATHR